MADAPPDGLYLEAASALIDSGRLEVTGAPPGPAGVSAVELPDGSVIEVDHTDPSRLVALDLDAGAAASSPLLVAAFGGDGALLLVDEAGGDAVAPRRDDPEELWNVDRRVLSTPQFQGSDAAVQFGRLVLLADLVDDHGLEPFARVAAAGELAVSIDSTPGGDLLAPLVPALLERADQLAADIDPDGLPALGPKRRAQLVGTLKAMRAADGSPLPEIAALVEAMERRRRSPGYSGGISVAAESVDVVAALFSAPEVDDVFDAAASGADASREVLEVHRVTPTLLTVTTARAEQERWVRVLRGDGLVLIALVPLHRHGLLDCAEAVVPPDTLDDELEIQIIDADAASAIGDRPADLIRRAVRAGRTASSAERSNNRYAADDHWSRCADLWAQLGDLRRAELAELRRGSRAGRFRGRPLLSDLVSWSDDPWA